MKEEDRVDHERDRLYQKEKNSAAATGKKKREEEKNSLNVDDLRRVTKDEGERKRAEDDDIDYVLDPAFASSAISRRRRLLPPNSLEGGTRWPLAGLPGPVGFMCRNKW